MALRTMRWPTRRLSRRCAGDLGVQSAMRPRRTIVLAAALLVASMAKSGHELPVYPSYYPHEIEIRTIAPGEAADAMRTGNLHAYVGTAPGLSTTPPRTVDSVALLGSLVVVRLNPDSPAARDDATACAVAAAIMRDMAATTDVEGFTFHPYPVTPWHGDYLSHVDRAEDARQRIVSGRAPIPPADIKVRAGSAAVRSLIRTERLTEGPRWDAAVEAIDVAGLVADASHAMNGWLGPRWVRSGWFHAHRVLGSSLPAPDQQGVQVTIARLQGADYETAVERINLERELVRSLTSHCHATVAGYTTKREFFNAEFSAGIENVSFDALEGFASPMFLRTVKLKDFPWNGSLRLGIAAPPETAWNPVAGFTDPFGRLLWFAIADPAAVPSPNEAGWTLNRISEVDISPRQ